MPPLTRRLHAHFRGDPAKLPVVSERFAVHQLADLQRAMDTILAGANCEHELIGVVGEQHMPPTLGPIAAPTPYAVKNGMVPTSGSVRYVNVDLANGQSIASVERGLYLVRHGADALAVLISGPGELEYINTVLVDVMAPTPALAEQFLSRLRDTMRKQSAYRGRVVSMEEAENRRLRIRFHRLSSVTRSQIILPPAVLDRIERQTVGFTRHEAALRAAGRHLKRGLLLHGPPGTGKTFTAMYLANQMHGRTVLLTTGRGMGLIESVCAMARSLVPSTVIIEDVDLIAEERGRDPDSCAAPVLFELLNQMDGLADDADVLFLLTTNRPDILEPALAARPGRIDQAIEVPLPDADCRRRLFQLYGEGLGTEMSTLEAFVARTEGTSAAFIRELLRRAAVFAADEGGVIRVSATHVDEALHELLVAGGSVTRNLLGAKQAGAAGRA